MIDVWVIPMFKTNLCYLVTKAGGLEDDKKRGKPGHYLIFDVGKSEPVK